ncbi:DUF742 domain-containing protein [Streptomyces sp. NBC_01474]|uniref:DUF742 domain-containing protein n=1 Tax=Streptomyces sp. NBC_01474 TaxID=2903880 RepID=UPI002DDA1A1B|nr:DUF742 domain-containing protein [Streptomyces sp. NBC_01474]WSD92820.1 DUF742 domain-containing protein [Streptomyces sp. NBC_01474]
MHGRATTPPRYQLALEALVLTTADDKAVRALPDAHRDICRLCRDVRSVAEVAALLDLPLGVARVLIADLAESGLITLTHPDDTVTDGVRDTALLERILTALHACA